MRHATLERSLVHFRAQRTRPARDEGPTVRSQFAKMCGQTADDRLVYGQPVCGQLAYAQLVYGQVATTRCARAGGPPMPNPVSPRRHAREDARVPGSSDTILVRMELVQAYEFACPEPILVAAAQRMLAQAPDSSDSSTDLAIVLVIGLAMGWACEAAQQVQSSFVAVLTATPAPAALVREPFFSLVEKHDQAGTASCILRRSRAELFRRGR
jgi:hypothetical protein